MLEKLKWGVVIAVSMVLGGAVVVGINSLDDDSTTSNSAVAVATATPSSDNQGTTTPAINTVSDTITSDVADLVEKVRPSVVRINATSSTSNAGGTGSGIVLNDDGFILTNNHVVDGFDKFDAAFADGMTAAAAVVGTDPGNDLAVIKVDLPADELQPATFGDSDKLRAGESVIAIGNPFDLEGTVTEGIVSGIGRTLQGSGRPLRQLIQSDAAINPGNSGGALFNAKGEVVGVTTAIENPSGDRVFVGIGYAVPSNVAMRFLPQLLKGETIEHPQLGVALQTITPSVAADLGVNVDQGVMVVSVEPGTGAAEAGLEGGSDNQGRPNGDVIVRIDDKDIKDYDDLADYIDSKDVGDTVNVVVLRNGEEVTLPVTLNAWQGS
jgi:S1-C subfamily serine protease